MALNKLKFPQNEPATPLLCLEINPPRGVDLEAIFARLDGKLSGVNFLNITDSALAKMRMNPLVFASLLKHRYGIEPLVNISCRDRNVIALQSDLLAGWASGVHSIIALTGDAVSIGDMPDSKGVFEINSIGLLNIINTLNAGKDLAGNDLHGAPSYYPGVVVNPNAKNPSAEIRRLTRKKDAGAVYALSQPVFDEESAVSFFQEAHAVGVSLFVGLLPFKNGKAVLGISRIPGIRIPPDIMSMAESNPEADLTEFSLEHCLKLAKKCRPYVRGFHVISGATPKLALQLTEHLVRFIQDIDK